MGTSQSKDSKTEGSAIGIDPTPCQRMNPSDQRNLLPPPPSLYTSSNDTASASQGSYGTPTMQGLPPLGSYTGSSQPYSHIPVNPIPGPPFHKIAQPMRPQEPVVSQQSLYQQYPQQGYAQSSYSQSFPQQLYPPHSYQSSYSSNPMHGMQQPYIQSHIPYQQTATSQSHTSPQKFDMYQQPFKSEQTSQSQLPVQPVAKPQTNVQSLTLPQGFQPPHAGQQSYSAQPLAQSQPISSVFQQPAGDANSPQSQHQMQPPQKPTTPPNQIQQNREAASVMPTPPSDSAQSDTSDVPPGSPEIKLTIKKTFDKGRPRLTSSLVRKDGSDRTDTGSGNELSRERELVDDSLHAEEKEQIIPAVPLQQDPVVSNKPKTVAQKRENFKAGKANALPKTTLPTNPPSTSFDEKPCEWLVGDLVWSKVTGHPWWPCMVAYDPNLGIYTRMKGAYGKSYRMYHVQFFGEVPERGWVSGCSMRKFTGKSQYNELVQELVSKIKKKSERARLMAKLALKPSRKSAWEASVVECEKALPMSRHERKLKFTFKYEIPKSAMGNLSAEQIDVVSLGDSPKMKAKRAYKKQQDSEAAAATCTTKSSSQPQTASLPTPAGSAPSDVDNHNLSLTPRAKRKYRKRKSNTTEPTPVPEPPRSKRKPGRKTAQFLEYFGKRQEEMVTQHPGKSKAEITALLEKEWDEIPDDEKCKIVTSPAPLPPRPARKRKVKEESPESDLVVKRSRRETKPSKKLQEADLDNLGFSPKMTKSLKLNEVEKADKRGKVDGTMSPPPSQAFTKLTSSQGRRKKRDASSVKKKEGRRSKHLINGATALTRVPVKAEKSGGETIATEMSKDFAEMQEDEPGLIIDTDLITGAIESAGVGQETTNGVPFSVSGHSSGDEQASTSNASHTSSANGAPRERGGGAAKKENVCQVCERTGELLLCEGGCCGAFHLDCIGLQVTPVGTFKCDECISAGSKDVKRCLVPVCGKYYHEECVKAFSQTRFEPRGFKCPLHLCSSCFSENPKSLKASKGRLMRCVRCPTSFHAGDSCIAAGSIVLASNAIVCSRHFQPIKTQKHHAHVSVSWCFICSIGGNLICCDSCPAAFHATCIGYSSVPEGNWNCRDCANGKRPRYSDIIWVKLGNYRWWPAQVCNPRNVPTNIQDMNHQVGEFPVQFFGSHDYFWTHQGRVFSYYEGDKGSKENAATKGLAAVFKAALTEAVEKYKEWKGFRDQKEARELENSSKKPRPFKFIKVNKPVGRVQMPPFDMSQCQPCDCKPTMENPCSKDSDCLNRILLVECHPLVCPAGEKCQNQRFQKRQYPEARSEKMAKRGWGLMALVDIKKGDFVNEYVGELVDEEECRERIRQAHDNNITDFYFLTLDKDRIIDAGPKGNLSRFMNHCCQPNCETQKWTVNGDTRVGLFAICDIPSNTELTFNYNLDCLGNEKKRCECGAPNCSGFMGVRPKTAAAEAQAEKHKKAVDRKKQKQRKRRVKIAAKVQHEDDCFRCGEGGELVMCDHKKCPKAYCLGCLNISKPPHGKWDCPWHHCDECGKLALELCEQCPNSYCLTHFKDKIRVVDEMSLCNDHDEEDVKQLVLKRKLKRDLAELERQARIEEEANQRRKQEKKKLKEELKQKIKEKELKKERRRERKKEKHREKKMKGLAKKADKTESDEVGKGKPQKRRARAKKVVKDEVKDIKPKTAKLNTNVEIKNNLPLQPTDSAEELPFLLDDSEGELVIDEDFKEEKKKKKHLKKDELTTENSASAVPKLNRRDAKVKKDTVKAT